MLSDNSHHSVVEECCDTPHKYTTFSKVSYQRSACGQIVYNLFTHPEQYRESFNNGYNSQMFSAIFRQVRGINAYILIPEPSLLIISKL